MKRDTAPEAGPQHDYRSFIPAFYNRAAALLRRIEGALDAAVRSSSVYARDAVARRLLQEVAFLLVAPLRREDARRALEGMPPLETSGAPFRCAGLEVDPRSGRVRCSVALWLRSMGHFLAHALAVLALAVAALPRRRNGVPAVLVFGVPEENLFPGDDAAFAQFARSGPIAPLNAARFLHVQTQKRDARSTDASRVAYARHPLLALASANPPGIGGGLALIGAHLRMLAVFCAGALRFPLLALLWRDYAYTAPARSLDERGLIEAIVLTNGLWGQQFLWMTDLPRRHYATHMVFYSMNDRPHAYLDIEERCSAHPTLRLLRADHFWVWTPGQAQALKEEGIAAELHVVGPILWALHRAQKREEPWISVFDITPLAPAANLELGLLGNYFAPGNLLAFLDGIEAASRISGAGLPIVIKPKREPVDSWHEPRYLARLGEAGTFRVLSPETSPYSVIARSALVIVYPYSSVAYVADALGVPAVYFDPTGRLAPMHEPSPNVRFVSDVNGLAAQIREVLERATCIGDSETTS